MRGQRDPTRLWMGLRGFGHDDAVMADFVLLNDPTADTDGAVNCTMALVDFMRYFTGKAIALRPKQREAEADRPRRLRCELHAGTEPGVYYFERRGEPADLPEDFSGWIACAPHDGVAHATTAHRTFLRCTRTENGGVQLPAGAAGRRRALQRVCSGPDRHHAGSRGTAAEAEARAREHRTPSQRPDRGRPGTAVSFFRAIYETGGTHYGKDDHHFGP